MGLAGTAMSVPQLGDLEVKRVSIGGSLGRATIGLIRRAAAQIRAAGTFGNAAEQVPDAELANSLPRGRTRPLGNPLSSKVQYGARVSRAARAPQAWNVVTADDRKRYELPTFLSLT